MTRKKKRPWLAALGSFVYPGLGHFYLRQWLRGFLWFGFMLLTAYFFIPPAVANELSVAIQNNDMAAYSQATQNLGLDVSLPLLFVSVCNIVDAYWSAVRNNRVVQEAVDGTVRCPNCGRKVDPEFDFCQWCSSSIDAESTAR
ncbi:zinc ribbon domain-containing protein [Haladaptatus sp. AB643]|uniref:zinc ribbon domain-containing protein n=1 Tax=unclassified Haladaptatus TaxID=2622732 RepID=UPI00209BF5B2|nr:zinc ribbon domain-containing protein [Haladaptatus sp. AB643]MCO8253882.1 zinc ribbon domain-containing protein [Haladaptatus sp. AB618]